MSYFSELDEEVRQMAGGMCNCGGAALESLSTQDLQDLFAIFLTAAKNYNRDRDMQLGMLVAIREEIGKRAGKL